MRAGRPRPVRDAWIGAGLFGVLAVVVALFDPTRRGHFPRCPFRAFTGIDCPGCGSLRALHDLTHGHVVAAADHNLMLVVFLPCALVVWLRVVSGRTSSRVLSAWVARGTVMAAVLWTVVRNLPVFHGVLGA